MKSTIYGAGIAVALILCACNGGNSLRESVACDSAISGAPAENQNTETQNTEEFSKITEEGFQNVFNRPYSTFSIDVDNASYSIMRRMVLNGTVPPNEEVRIEEWINYFSYQYPQPSGKEPFSINTEYSDCPWNKEHKLLQIGLKGKEAEEKNLPPSNLVFLLDVSGSMDAADKLPLLKNAFGLLLPKLREEDRISIVVYAGAAGVVLESAKGTDRDKIAEALERLQAGGATGGGEGIELAYSLAEENFIRNGINRIILATDGDFNVGISTEAGLEHLIKEKRAKGIYLSVLGFGSGNIKDNKMETLADKGNGNYYYIDNMLEAKKVLVEQFGGTLHTIAKDVKIQIEFNPAYVKEYRLIGYEDRRLQDSDFNDDKKDAGELGSGHTVTALYEIVEADSKEQHSNVDALKYQENTIIHSNKNEFANIKFRYKEPGKEDTTSRLITKSVNRDYLPFQNTSDNYKLATSVAEFGLIMRGSEYKAEASFKNSYDHCSQVKSGYNEEYLSEFKELIKAAEDLKKN